MASRSDARLAAERAQAWKTITKAKRKPQLHPVPSFLEDFDNLASRDV